MAKNTSGLKPFEKGISGNPNGRPEGTKNRSTIVKKWLEVIEETTNSITKEKEDLSQQDQIVLALIKKAKKGDVAAFKELMDSAHGKIVDQKDITSNGNTFSIPVIKWIGESEHE